MKIYKVIADRRPSDCMFCPIYNGVYTEHLDCGQKETSNVASNIPWTRTHIVPDQRCLIEIKEG